MTRYTLNATDGEYSTTVEFDAEQIDDILMYMKMFLQGAGFTWIQGELQIVEDEPIQHNAYYYDTERNR
jgi:hypothetical protein